MSSVRNEDVATPENCTHRGIDTIILGVPCPGCDDLEGYVAKSDGYRICKLCNRSVELEIPWEEFVNDRLESKLYHVVGDGRTLIMNDDLGLAHLGQRQRMVSLFGLIMSEKLGDVSSGEVKLDPEKFTRINDGRKCPRCKHWNEPFYIRRDKGGYYHSHCHHFERITDRSWNDIVQDASRMDYVMSGSILVARNAIPPGTEKMFTDLHGKKIVEGGCFIATATYGTDQCWQVTEIRNFRDNILLKNIIGKLLVRIYYSISPYVALIIWKHPNIKLILKPILNKFASMHKNVK